MKKHIGFILFLGLAAPLHAVWDVTTPAGSEAKSLGDDRIREFKSDIQTALQYEGDFPGPDTTNPRFLYTPSTGTTLLRPTGSTNTARGMLFINKSSGTIEQYNGSTWDVVATTIPLPGGVGPTELSPSAAGAALVGGGGAPLDVNADTNTFTVAGDTLAIKADSIGSAQLAAAIALTSVESSTYTRSGFGILPILQIQEFDTATASDTINATAYSNTNVTVSITPKLSTSKIMVVVSGSANQNVGDQGHFTLARNGSNLCAAAGCAQVNASNGEHITMQWYDSPATTSATTYTVQYKNNAATGSGGMPTGGTTAVIFAIELAQ